MSTRYRAPRGTVDVLPEEQPYWDRVYQTATRLAELFGYARIEKIGRAAWRERG